MQDFAFIKFGNSQEILGYTGHWQAAELQLHSNAIYLQAWDKNLPLLQLMDVKTCTINQLKVKLQDYQNRDPSDQLEFISYVETILEHINRGDVKKVVPARKQFFETKIDAIDLFNKCIRAYPQSNCYLLHSQEYGTWMGASPELFYNYKNGIANTMALAGTIHNGISDLFSQKEFEEQNLVVKHISEIAQEYALNLQVSPAETHVAAHLSHLRSAINMQISETNAIAMIKKMHPTAAVGGFTQEQALQIIEKHESIDRKLYSGWIGTVWEKEFNAFVNLRCCQLFNNGILCYAGCGVNQGSDSIKEYYETCNKMNVMYFLTQISES